MNKRIKLLAIQADWDDEFREDFDIKKFAELIVRECCQALHPMLRDQISRGQGVDLIKQHFGVKE